jgi:hypothetical protein
MAQLYWDEDEKGKAFHLRAGCLETIIASLYRRTKWWEAVIWLPDIGPTKQYAPLEFQKEDVAKQCEHWFGLANTSRPAMDDPSKD